MKRLFDIKKIANNFIKIASRLRSSSNFQIEFKKSVNGKTGKRYKRIDADIKYNPCSKRAKVEIHETSKRGIRNRAYVLNDISESEVDKMCKYLNEEKWNMFFLMIDKFK